MGYDLKLNPDGFIEYKHHSNPFNAGDAKVFYDKLILRPDRSKAWDLIKSGKKEEGDLILYEHGHYQDHLGNHIYTDAPPMLFGRAVQYYCDLVLIEDASPAEAYREAINLIQGYKSPHWRDAAEEQMKIDDVVNGVNFNEFGERPRGKDAELNSTEFELICKNAIEGMREATKGANRISGEEELGGKLNGCNLPYLGFADYQGGGVELKTKWGRKPPEKLPYNYLTQLAGYWHFSGIQPKLVMSSRYGYKIYSPSIEELENALRAVISACQRREALLYSSSRKDHLLRLTEPNFEGDFRWNGMNPLHIKNARKLWRMD